MTRAADILGIAAAAMGAAGVAAAAAAAHAGGGDLARMAAQFLVLHAAAVMGVGAHARASSVRRARALLAVGSSLALGTLLFAGDLAMRGFAGQKLFPFAAPIGGSWMILSWAALAFVFARRE
jgi:uncharacterized membrane protein YgdD (TMEM256/DUF423 family)